MSTVILLGGCGELGFNNWRWHQKMTVEVEVDGRLVLASAVSSVHWWPNFFGTGGWGGPDWLSEVEGEAVVVDLGERGMLFALLSDANRQEYTENLPSRVLADTTERVWGKEAFSEVVVTRRILQVPPKLYPLLVTFDDINDPTTVKRVDPDNLAASFGLGVSLKRITLTITDEPVTEGEVEKLLGWLREYYGKQLDGRRYETVNSTNRFANSLGAGSFDTQR
ncbi:hypothetical protein [Mesorhizobium sp. Z1-4]|uniref:hypothetical protein n=1 Tax=Mesorhizobium sp. Z1-4 TaxID=2448478 RepID=UPI00197ECD25|nr:hypothetical protein [Mesorhizobium sp. Z1-4]